MTNAIQSTAIHNDVALPQVNVLGSTMAYREAGDREAPVALFLHGNPTSSYIWRNILPLVASVAHCIAPDLIGFGQSGKPDIEYRFVDQVRYVDAFLHRAGNLVSVRHSARLGNRSGIHYLQEDHPDVIGANIKEWLIAVGVGSSPKQKLTL